MERYGKVKNIQLVRHIVTGASRGYAFFEFDTEKEMRRAYEVLSPPSRNGGSKERKDVHRDRTYEAHSTKRYSADRGYSSRSSVDRERPSHRKSKRYGDEHSQERDGYKERSPHSKKRRSLDRGRSTRNSKDRDFESLSDSQREEELSHRNRPNAKHDDTSRRKTGDKEEPTSHRRSKDEEHYTRRSKDGRTCRSRRSKEHSQKRHKHSS